MARKIRSEILINEPAALRIADAILSGNAPDPTGGAVNFLNPKLQKQLGRSIPSWAQGQGQRIGNHVFFGGQPGFFEVKL